MGQQVDAAQVRKAVAALVKHHKVELGKKGTKDLLGGDDAVVQVVLAFAKVPRAPVKKPFRLTVPHPVASLDESEVCLFVKDPASEAKTLLEAQGIKVSQVLSVSKLKSHYSTYELRRKLLASYDGFLADKRVLDMLGRLLGKGFFAAKRQPLPVSLTVKGKGALRKEMETALQSALLYYGQGPCSVVRAGHTGQTADELVANVSAVVSGAAGAVPGGWSNIRSINIKLPQSVSLPVFEAPLHVDEERVQQRKRRRDEGEASDSEGEWSDDDPFKDDEDLFARFQEEHGLSSDDDEIVEARQGSAKRRKTIDGSAAAEEAGDAPSGEQKSKQKKSKISGDAAAAAPQAKRAKKAGKAAEVQSEPVKKEKKSKSGKVAGAKAKK